MPVVNRAVVEVAISVPSTRKIGSFASQAAEQAVLVRASTDAVLAIAVHVVLGSSALFAASAVTKAL